MIHQQAYVRLPWERDLQNKYKSAKIIGDAFSRISASKLLKNIEFLFAKKDLFYYTCNGKIIENDDEAVFDLKNPLFIDVNLRLKGGKGGYGSLLRAQGNKMSSRKSTNFESCRDLEGRRLRTVHQTQA